MGGEFTGNPSHGTIGFDNHSHVLPADILAMFYPVSGRASQFPTKEHRRQNEFLSGDETNRGPSFKSGMTHGSARF